jgi:hypothetical protein
MVFLSKLSRISSKDLTGLKEFIKDYPEARAHLIYGGTDLKAFEE